MIGDHYESFLNIDKCIQLMDDKRFQVVSSWEQIKNYGVDPLGRLLFKNIFTIAPEALELFSFKEVSDLESSPELKAHYTRVIESLN